MSCGGSQWRWCKHRLRARGIPYSFSHRARSHGRSHRTRVVSWIAAALIHRPTKISLGTSIAWCRTIWSEFELLTGKAAAHEFTKVVTYKTMTFNPEIKAVDTVRVYHVRSLTPLPQFVINENLRVAQD